jgi:hypothetical protein
MMGQVIQLKPRQQRRDQERLTRSVSTFWFNWWFWWLPR